MHLLAQNPQQREIIFSCLVQFTAAEQFSSLSVHSYCLGAYGSSMNIRGLPYSYNVNKQEELDS